MTKAPTDEGARARVWIPDASQAVLNAEAAVRVRTENSLLRRRCIISSRSEKGGFAMEQRKRPKKLQLHSETLKHVGDGVAPATGESLTSPGCTVWTSCSPECCDTNAKR